MDKLTSMLALLRLPPSHLVASILFVAGMVVACELLRVSLSPVLTRSVIAHVLVNLLTAVVLPVFLAVVLVLSIAAHPDRALINLGIVAGLYVLWYLAGQATLLARPDTQGADPGFMFVGSVITFVPGLIAVAVC
jgi:hypothetical protein